jgi:hypothetical protein
VFFSLTCSYAGGGNYNLGKQDCARFCDFIVSGPMGGGVSLASYIAE